MATASPGATLRDEQQVIGSIVELMKTEQQFLISADADGLSTITPNKLQLAQRAATLARVRHKALAAKMCLEGGIDRGFGRVIAPVPQHAVGAAGGNGV